ncbi:MAG: hypothetical protein Q8862_00035 [Bacteroidota bacterium]|nr:hypothetical protein [Bacteroidota bacterium]
MKTISLNSIVFAIAVFFSTLISNTLFASSTITGNSNTWLGNYTLTPSVNPVVINGKEYKAWILKYEKSNHEIVVAIDQLKKGKNYIVKTDRFEIQYSCNGTGMGVRKVSNSYSTIEYERNYGKIDDTQFGYQRKLTLEDKNGEDDLGIIACYFPRLLKKEYQYVLD